MANGSDGAFISNGAYVDVCGSANERIDGTAFIAHGAVVTGDVHIASECGIWYGAVVRGDEASISIGARSNVQDNVTVHVDAGFPVDIGAGVTIGHNAVVHGCSIGDNTLIGMGAIICSGARIGSNCIIGAGALVTQGKIVPDGSVWVGSPARHMRAASENDIAANERNAAIYVQRAREAMERGEEGGRRG